MSRDARAVAEIDAVSDSSKVHTVMHYLYVPSRDAARIIACQLQLRGYRTEERLGADGVNWLVLACHETTPGEEVMVSLRQSMEELVSLVDGEYDGWEAKVGHSC